VLSRTVEFPGGIHHHPSHWSMLIQR